MNGQATYGDLKGLIDGTHALLMAIQKRLLETDEKLWATRAQIATADDKAALTDPVLAGLAADLQVRQGRLANLILPENLWPC